MPRLKNPDYYPVRINMLENAVENSVFLEKSGVSDYTLFGSIISERSWSLPDACNTYTSLYYDNMLDIDCFVDCGTWTTFGSRTYLNCNTSSGYLQIGIYGNYRGAYTEFDTETDSTYVVDINITGYNTMATWQVSARDNQGNIIASSMVSQTGPMSFEFTATGSVSRVYVMRVTSYYTFASIALSALSVTGKYHKEDVMYLSYRYGFNNMEKDDELKGTGNSYDFGARIYDPRVGRFLSVDPLWKSNTNSNNYSFAGNSPILYIDLKGLFQWPTGEEGERLKERYPKAYKYLCDINNKEKSILQLLNSSKVMDGILNNAGGNLALQGWHIPYQYRGSDFEITQEDVISAFTPDEGPQLLITMNPGESSPMGAQPQAGGYNPSNSGKNYSEPIELNERMFYNLQNASTAEEEQAALLIIYTTLIHEYLEYFGPDDMSATIGSGPTTKTKNWGARVAINQIYDDNFVTYLEGRQGIEIVIRSAKNIKDKSTLPKIED
jgi:RHS repeat-associated protein